MLQQKGSFLFAAHPRGLTPSKMLSIILLRILGRTSTGSASYSLWAFEEFRLAENIRLETIICQSVVVWLTRFRRQSIGVSQFVGKLFTPKQADFLFSLFFLKKIPEAGQNSGFLILIKFSLAYKCTVFVKYLWKIPFLEISISISISISQTSKIDTNLNTNTPKLKIQSQY